MLTTGTYSVKMNAVTPYCNNQSNLLNRLGPQGIIKNSQKDYMLSTYVYIIQNHFRRYYLWQNCGGLGAWGIIDINRYAIPAKCSQCLGNGWIIFGPIPFECDNALVLKSLDYAGVSQNKAVIDLTVDAPISCKIYKHSMPAPPRLAHGC